jgi:hypothetical protein
MARRATNIENLKPFKKGQSGNPKGRPQKLPAIDELLAKVLNEAGANGLTRAEIILRKMAIKAETDIRAAEMIFDRAYGRPRQQVENINTNVNPYTTLSDEELIRMMNDYVNTYNQSHNQSKK